ncbi:hypothetical protein Rhow_007138 [Rhodococcus wratislaviensis]|uniref:Uncharacterized protein n=1 Tax=Rhodococcus wratislaviensis TaxID=44752 RepID=A0A402CHG1_RHOWR|nr:hypothetical protein Rhow_007138 [Rhodococcus wratislaviensis]
MQPVGREKCEMQFVRQSALVMGNTKHYLDPLSTAGENWRPSRDRTGLPCIHMGARSGIVRQYA